MKESKINTENSIIIKFVAITLLFFYSCTGRVNNEPAITSLIVVFYNNGDTLRSENISKEIINDIKKLRSDRKESTDCQPTGAVHLYRGDDVIDKIEFSTDATGADGSCQMLLSQNKGWRLTYRIGMFLDETFYRLKNKK